MSGKVTCPQAVRGACLENLTRNKNKQTHTHTTGAYVHTSKFELSGRGIRTAMVAHVCALECRVEVALSPHVVRCVRSDRNGCNMAEI